MIYSPLCKLAPLNAEPGCTKSFGDLFDFLQMTQILMHHPGLRVLTEDSKSTIKKAAL